MSPTWAVVATIPSVLVEAQDNLTFRIARAPLVPVVMAVYGSNDVWDSLGHSFPPLEVFPSGTERGLDRASTHNVSCCGECVSIILVEEGESEGCKHSPLSPGSAVLFRVFWRSLIKFLGPGDRMSQITVA